MTTKYIFNPKKLIPKSLAVETSGSDLYRIGLTNQFVSNNNNSVKRNALNNPKLVFTVLLIILIRSIINLSISKDDLNLCFYLGDYTSFIPGARIHANIANICLILICLFSKLTHLWYSRKNVQYSWFGIFAVICGNQSPQNIGIKIV